MGGVACVMRDPVRRIYPHLGKQNEKSSPMKEIDAVVRDGIKNFVSNPPRGFLVPEDWTGKEMTFYLIENDDDKFIYMVRIGGRYFSNHFLYYWKKHSGRQVSLNRANLLPGNSRWTDTLFSSRTGKGSYNSVRAILQEIGLDTAETI